MIYNNSGFKAMAIQQILQILRIFTSKRTMENISTIGFVLPKCTEPGMKDGNPNSPLSTTRSINRLNGIKSNAFIWEN